LPKFDYIFYFPPEFEIKDDGFRNIDKYFQLKTHNEFEKYIAIFNFDNVHKITGTVKERIDTIKKIIKKRECNEKFTRHSTTKKRF
jgi:hypothetical protein